MSTTLNRRAYQSMVDENVAWLMSQPETMEREHTILIVQQSVKWLYDEKPCGSGCPADAYYAKRGWLVRWPSFWIGYAAGTMLFALTLALWR